MKIGKDLAGGAGPRSGVVLCGEGAGRIVSVTIGGSIIGGIGAKSGGVQAGDPGSVAVGASSLGNVTVGGSIVGGSAAFAGGVFSHATAGTEDRA